MLHRTFFILAIGGILTENDIKREADGLKYRGFPASPDTDERIKFRRKIDDSPVKLVPFKGDSGHARMSDLRRLGREPVDMVNERKFYGFERECPDLHESVFAFAYLLDGFAVAPFHFRGIPI